MTTKHRKRSQAAKRFATMGAATATAAVLTAGLVSPTTTAQPVNPLFKTQRAEAVSLAAAYNGYGTENDPIFPPPADIPDLTGGFGTQVYNALQNAADPAFRDLVNALAVPGIGEVLGLTQAGVNAALGALIVQALSGIPIDLGSLTSGLSPALQLLLGPVLNLIPVDNVAELLALLGFDLDDPLGNVDGVNIVTAGAPFTLLKLLGVDLGWNPPFPNSVANDILSATYLDIGVGTLLNNIDQLPNASDALKFAVGILRDDLPAAVLNGDLVALRIPIVGGFGLSAFAVGAGYRQVASQVSTWPGGLNYAGTDSPLLGSITILPMLLLRNPGRANGGLLARAYPLFHLLGIDTVTPETEVTNSGGAEIADTGLYLGGATLIPIKIDATVEYDPLSDFPSWPNPIALANSVAAEVFPTYILRGLDTTTILSSVTDQLGPQIAAIVASLGNDDPLALNLYLTVPVKDALPLMEPVKLFVEAINLVSPVKFNNPVATALEPALTSLVNLGYTDAELGLDSNGDPAYIRTLLEAATPTSFGTSPARIDSGQVPEVVLNQFVKGVQKAIADGLIDETPGPNVLEGLFNLVGGLGGLSTLTQGLSARVLSGPTTPDLNAIVGQATSGLGLQSVTGATAKPAQANLVQSEESNTPTVLDNVESTLSYAQDGLKERAETLKLSGAAAEGNLKKATKQLSDAADNARDQADNSLKKASKRFNDIVEKGRKDIERAVKDVDTQAKKSIAKVKSTQKKAQAKAAS